MKSIKQYGVVVLLSAAFSSMAFADITEQILKEIKTKKRSIVAFLKALTDERVRYRKAPFDHPQLFIPNGQSGDQNNVTDDGEGNATDELLEIPAVGANGGAPLRPLWIISSNSAGEKENTH